jgi:hypothetical protein
MPAGPVTEIVGHDFESLMPFSKGSMGGLFAPGGTRQNSVTLGSAKTGTVVTLDAGMPADANAVATSARRTLFESEFVSRMITYNWLFE